MSTEGAQDQSQLFQCRFSGRDEPHKCHFLAPRKRESSQVTSSIQTTQDTQTLCFLHRKVRVQLYPNIKKNSSLNHFSNPHPSSFIIIKILNHPLERGTMETDYQKHQNTREEKNRRSISLTCITVSIF